MRLFLAQADCFLTNCCNFLHLPHDSIAVSLRTECPLECTRTIASQTTSSRMRSQCTCSPAYGTPMIGPQEEASRRPIGRTLPSSPATKTLVPMPANWRTLTRHASPPPPRAGGTSTLPGSRQPAGRFQLGRKEPRYL